MRALKFSKHLPAFGWRPVVLTGHSPLGIPLDPSLEVPEGVAVYRVRPTAAFAPMLRARRSLLARLVSAVLLIPDPFVGWLPAVLKRGLKIVQEERPEVILATSPPNSSQLVGWVLSRLTGLPLVADFRDAWLTDPDRNRSLHNRLRLATVERVMEALVVRHATSVVAVSDAIVEDFRRRYPWKPASAFVKIENGYDESDLEGAKPIRLEGYSIVLTGSMDKPHRSAEPLLRAVARVLDRAPAERDTLRVYLVGTAAASDRDVVHHLGLSSNVVFTGWVRHAEALGYQQAADVNVMLWHGPGDARASQMMSGKVFEYIAAGRPILAAIPGTTAAASMLARVPSARVLSPGDIDGMQEALTSLMASRGSSSATPDPRDLRPYTRRWQAGQLAAVLSNAADS
jgi:glycosyltransferase involved in cell wall biosynthesis